MRTLDDHGRRQNQAAEPELRSPFGPGMGSGLVDEFICAPETMDPHCIHPLTNHISRLLLSLFLPHQEGCDHDRWLG